MKSNTNKKNHQKRKRRNRRLKLFRNVLAAGLLLGITGSFCKALLLHAATLKDTVSEPALVIYDHTAECDPDPRPEKSPRSLTLAEADQFVSVKQVSGDEIHDQNLLTDAEVDAKLAELALQDEDIAEIYAQKERYPEALLTALSANQELTGFVKGYLTAERTVTGGISDEEKAQDFPLFIQWDSRWGYAPYGKKNNIGISGCGPACMSMVIFALTRDETATPDALAAFSEENGYYMEGEGTAWLFMTDAAREYGITARELGLDEAVIRQYVENGHPVICAMRPGDFTATGHFIVIYGCDEKGFLINDPNSRERSNRHWRFEDIKWQIRNLWGYSNP